MNSKSRINSITAAHEPLANQNIELGPQAIKPQPNRYLEGNQPAKVATAGELMAHLLETGTNPEKMQSAQRWIRENPSSSAIELLRYLEDAEERLEPPINPGTLRKAGKWLWGDSWEPTSETPVPADELERLRGEVATRQAQATIQANELASMRAQLDFLTGERGRLLAENANLRAGTVVGSR